LWVDQLFGGHLPPRIIFFIVFFAPFNPPSQTMGKSPPKKFHPDDIFFNAPLPPPALYLLVVVYFRLFVGRKGFDVFSFLHFLSLNLMAEITRQHHLNMFNLASCKPHGYSMKAWRPSCQWGGDGEEDHCRHWQEHRAFVACSRGTKKEAGTNFCAFAHLQVKQCNKIAQIQKNSERHHLTRTVPDWSFANHIIGVKKLRPKLGHLFEGIVWVHTTFL
jgi:hypothetical protein